MLSSALNRQDEVHKSHSASSSPTASKKTTTSGFCREELNKVFGKKSDLGNFVLSSVSVDTG